MAVTTVFSVPDDGRKGRPKHVELLTPNKEHKKLHLVGIFMISNKNKNIFIKLFGWCKAKRKIEINQSFPSNTHS